MSTTTERVQYTFGPWTVMEYDVETATRLVVNMGSISPCIATFTKRTAPAILEKHRARAHLIAAAPALLDACKATAFHCNSENAYAGGYIISVQNAKQLRTAIALAQKPHS